MPSCQLLEVNKEANLQDTTSNDAAVPSASQNHDGYQQESAVQVRYVHKFV